MITINHYLTIDKRNDQLQDNKEQIQCKIQGCQSSVQEE
jgi:sulfur transfer protein SufE